MGHISKSTLMAAGRRAALVTILLSLLIGAGNARLAFAYKTAPGFTETTIAAGFPSNADIGPTGLAFDSSNTLFVLDFATGILYKVQTTGGVSTVTQVNTTPIPGQPAGLAFGKDGLLYATLYGADQVVQLNTTTGAIARTVAMSIPVPTGIATDPLSGDLFVSEECTQCTPGIVRISNFANGPGTVTTYTPSVYADGLTFGPDGTLYAAVQTDSTIAKIAGTNQPNAGAATSLGVTVPTIDGIAVAASPNPSTPPFLLANRNDGAITKIDLSASPPALTDIVTGGSRGDFAAVGPDGCFYATQSTSIIKVSNADGSCSIAPTGAVPQLSLAPAAVASALPLGTTQTFTATLGNVTSPAGTAITFTVSGANARTVVAAADASGVATISYAGVNAGTDSIVATTRAGGTSLTSNTSTVTWVAASSPTAGASPPVSSPTPTLTPARVPTSTSASPTAAPSPVSGASPSATAAPGLGGASHPSPTHRASTPRLQVVVQPPVVRPGAVQRLSISYIKDALVQARITFRGLHALTLSGATDSHGRLTLGFTVPRHIALHSGHASGHATVIAESGSWRRLALLTRVLRRGAIGPITVTAAAHSFVGVAVTFAGQAPRMVYAMTGSHGRATFHIAVPRAVARRHGQTLAHIAVWALTVKHHAQVSRTLRVSDMVISVVPGPIAHCGQRVSVHVGYVADVPLRIVLLLPHGARRVITGRTDRHGALTRQVSVNEAQRASSIRIVIQVVDARPRVHRLEQLTIGLSVPHACRR